MIDKIKKAIVKLLIKLIHNEYEVYSLTIKNTNDLPSKAILFGHNLFYSKFNFGSDKGVEVLNDYSSYEQILFESQAQTKICAMQIISNSTNIKNKVIRHKKECGWGVKVSIPIILSEHFGENQTQKNVIVVDKPIKINGNVFLEIPMDANEKITILFFGEKYYENLKKQRKELTGIINN